eukprot:m51a1_g11501 putative dynein light chain roadblock-type 2-like (160) ;mRNA; r:2678-4989
MSEVEETLKRIESHKGVVGVVIVNSAGVPIRSTLDNTETQQYAALVTQLASKARSTVRDLDPSVEETLKRIESHKGVVGVVIVNSAGVPIRSTLDNTETQQYAALVTQLASKARSTVRDLDPSNDLTFLRVRSKKHEIMIAPEKEYTLIVIQNPSAVKD